LLNGGDIFVTNCSWMTNKTHSTYDVTVLSGWVHTPSQGMQLYHWNRTCI